MSDTTGALQAYQGYCLDKLEAEASKALDMIAEVDDLIEEYRDTIKNNFQMEQWEKFGIMDKGVVDTYI